MPEVYPDPVEKARESENIEVLTNIVKHSENPEAVRIAKRKLDKLSKGKK